MDSRTGLPVVGMVGAGQLARMTHQAAIALGQSLRILAASPDDGAALVAADVVVGSHESYEALSQFADGCDVVTFDHEHVPNEHIARLAAAGCAVRPGAEALRHAQDKLAMRRRLTELGIPGPRWAPVSDVAQLRAFASDGAASVVVKAAVGGYDGKGVWLADSFDDFAPLFDTGVPLLVEEKAPIVRELAAVVARSPFGQGAAWPVVETVQRDGICVEVLAPAPHLSDERANEAQTLALRIAAELDVVGVLAVELFETADGILVNELAMRPHNSAHWTIEGSRTSQFEQHLRAVLDYPLGATEMVADVVVMVNLLGGAPGGMPIDERVHHMMARWPDVKLHLYGKQVRPGRKIGHVTAFGSDMELARSRAHGAAEWLTNGGDHP
jgi:5-(carboxyamino)imidazole ribonucleotide synthase